MDFSKLSPSEITELQKSSILIINNQKLIEENNLLKNKINVRIK